jgi:hypothetical protein
LSVGKCTVGERVIPQVSIAHDRNRKGHMIVSILRFRSRCDRQTWGLVCYGLIEKLLHRVQNRVTTVTQTERRTRTRDGARNKEKGPYIIKFTYNIVCKPSPYR